MPCPGPFHFSHIADYIYDFCLLPDPDFGLSILVCDVEHTSFHFGLCGRKFFLCLFGQCPCRSLRHKKIMSQLAAHRSYTPVSSGRWQGCF